MIKPKEIIQIGNTLLENPTHKVKDLHSSRTKMIVKKLETIFLKYYSLSAGLAAPQIGFRDSICIVRRYDREPRSDARPSYTVMINPEISTASNKESVFWEGCLSIGWGSDGLFAPVSRPATVSVTYRDTKGKNKTISGSDFFSHVLQHEIDHLNGILFLSHVTDPTQVWKSKDLDTYIEEHGDYPYT